MAGKGQFWEFACITICKFEFNILKQKKTMKTKIKKVLEWLGLWRDEILFVIIASLSIIAFYNLFLL